MNRAWACLSIVTLLCGACKNAPAHKAVAPALEVGNKEAADMEWKGQFCGVLQGSHRVINTAQQWQAVWAEIGQAAPAAPDFKAYFAVAAFLGQRNTGGHGIKWAQPDSSGPATVVRYREIRPRGIAIQVLTQPFAVKLFPRSMPEALVEALPE